jgi:hypothetical protein
MYTDALPEDDEEIGDSTYDGSVSKICWPWQTGTHWIGSSLSALGRCGKTYRWITVAATLSCAETYIYDCPDRAEEQVRYFLCG